MNRVVLVSLMMVVGSIVAVGVAPAHNVNCATAPAPHSYVPGIVASPHMRVGDGVTVADNNFADCDGDGIPGDFDGDYELGAGGAFFGAGPWANEPTCQYGLKTHGSTATVTDLLSANIALQTGADDQQGPIVIPDPVNGGNICETDGSITPCAPADEGGTCGPTDDPDDCLSQVYINTGSACGFGGDGGYWVYYCCIWVRVCTPAGCYWVRVCFHPCPLIATSVDADEFGIQASGVPTTGFIATA